MAYVTFGQAALRKQPRRLYRGAGAVASGGPSSPDAPVDWKAVALRMRGKKMPRAARLILAKAERGGTLSAYEEEYLHGFFKKVFKSVGKVVKAVVKPVVSVVKAVAKPILQVAKAALPALVGLIPGVGPVAGAAVAAAQQMRADEKARAAAVAQLHTAPSWGTLTPAEQAAILNAMAAGAVPNIEVPKDVAEAYQRAIQAAAPPMYTTVPTPGFGPPLPAPGGPQLPMPWEAAPMPTEAQMMPGGLFGMGPMGTMAVMGAGILTVTLLLGGGGRRR